MKTKLIKNERLNAMTSISKAGQRPFGSRLLIAGTLLLLFTALPTTRAANSTYTATGSVIDVPVPGIWCTNPLSQVIMRGNAHLTRVEGSDPRLTGRRLIFVNGAMQPDGSALLSGTS